MKLSKIAHHQRQRLKIREGLGDQVNPIDEIRRPAGMKRTVFRAKMKRLLHHEEQIAVLMLEGLRQYSK